MTLYEYFDGCEYGLSESFIVTNPPEEERPVYWSDEWYQWLIDHNESEYFNWFIATQYGERELMPFIEERTNGVLMYVNQTLLANRYKYQHLYELYTAEYNPIWNVDGTETITKTGSETDTGTETTTRTGTDTNEASGTDTGQDAVTTYDSATHKDTVKDTETYGRTDTLTHNTTDERTPDLEHGFDWTETHTRGGNIGVTMTQQLESAELEWTGKFNLYRIIAQDVVGAISYPFNY